MHGESSVTFQAVDPSNGNELEGIFYEATPGEVAEAVESAGRAFSIYRNKTGKEKALFLETIASEILHLGDALIARCCAETGLPEGRITLRALRDKGFRLCLDDFRVAAASLGSLEQLPFDEIKIHAIAIKRAQGNPVRMKVLAAITGLAHSLGMTVCAEGIEDEETFEFLKTIECDKMQGFLISEAVMPKLLRQVYGPGESSEHVA